ncbi:MAG TPA: glutaminyl-peptide cyclotransferase [Allosphingosinicella sp.]|jgi:glutamine cyclotransferase
MTILLALFAAAALQQTPAAVPVQVAEVTASFPHDPQAFTQGLFFADGQLYESTGVAGRSTLRKVRLTDGKVLQSASIPPDQFGEGSTAWGNEIISLTWQHGIAHRWDRATLRHKGSVRYSGEGWGLTGNGRSLILSDGTSTLRVLDPATFKEQRRIAVTAGGRPLDMLNELEWVSGEIWANIWKTGLIARIDPASGAVKGWIDLTALARLNIGRDPEAVPNGIAYEPRSKRLFVTGKLWSKLYEIKLVPL